MEDRDTPLMQEAKHALEQIEVPDPGSDLELLGVRVHEVDGPREDRLLLAFGRVPLSRWLDVVSAYNALHGEKPVCSSESDHTVVSALNRLRYERVTYKAVGEGFRLLWDTRGTVPVTVWEVAPREL